MEKKCKKYEKVKNFFLQSLYCKDYEKLPLISFNKRNWKKYLLDELFDSLKGKGLNKNSLSPSGDNKCLLYGELYTTYNEIIHKIISFTDDEEGVLSETCDILIPMSTTTKGEDLATASLLLEENVLIGGDILILRKKVDFINEEFITYLLSNTITKKIARLTQGITIIHQYWRFLKKIEINIPHIDEQNKIVDLLINVDYKIQQLEEEISLIKKFKKSLLSKMFC